MKTKFLFIFAVMLAAAPVCFATTNDLSSYLQRGLLEEEANHNLDAAVSAYQSAIAQFDKERQLAATAIYRLGESLRKQGKTNDATAQFERVVREFPEQTQLAELSRKNLSATGGTPARYQPDLDGTPLEANPNDEVARAEAKWIAELKRKIKDSPDLLNAEGGKELHDAARIGHSSVIRFLLDNGADVNSLQENRETPLHEAAKAGRKTIVELLLARGANVNAADREGDTPLHDAAKRGFKAVVEVLLANHADVNAKDTLGTTPLHMAARNGSVLVLQLLLTNGAQMNAKDDENRTPLFSALREDRTDAVRLLLANKAEVNVVAKGGWTPLLSAVVRHNVAAVKMLLAGKADVEAQLSDASDIEPAYRNARALHMAIDGSQEAVVNLLLEAGADPNVKMKTSNQMVYVNPFSGQQEPPKQTALIMAINYERLEIVRALLDHHADPDLPGTAGTPLTLAVQRSQPKIVELLLAHHADPNKPATPGAPPIVYAKDKPEILDILRRAGADENFARTPWISVGRKPSYMQNVFLKSQEGHNHYTLFELIADHYANTSHNPGYTGLPFPDFAHVKINRLLPDGKTEDIPVDLDLAFRTDDCSKNIPLEFGDVVQIPEADHPLTANWTMLPASVQHVLDKCLERQVEIIVKGKSTKVKLYPQRPTYGTPAPRFPSIAPNGLTGSAEGAGPDHLVPNLDTFWLNTALRDANVLLASSDLSRLKIKRTDPATKKVNEFTFNASAVNPSANIPDLWLEDGDVIEVPERDPNTPVAPNPPTGGLTPQRSVPGSLPAPPALREIPVRSLHLAPSAPPQPVWVVPKP